MPVTFRGRLKRLLRAFLALLPYIPPVYLASRVLTFLGPGDRHSTTNNLHFGLVARDSPLHGDAYPVSITAGVVPKRFHAHNDYVHEIPLLKALSYGAGSVEADIWLVDDELYVGHDAEDISPERTFKVVYLDPLLAILDAANAAHPRAPGERPRGVFELAPYLPLHLLIDIKTDGPSTFKALLASLAPVPSALTIIGTGNTPLASVRALGDADAGAPPRDVFLDAVLELVAADAEGEVYTPALAPLASSDFKKSVGSSWAVPGIGRARVRALVKAAHDRGIQARFWHTPGAPVAARNAVWQMLLDEGVDWLNVDDLAAAREF